MIDRRFSEKNIPHFGGIENDFIRNTFIIVLNHYGCKVFGTWSCDDNRTVGVLIRTVLVPDLKTEKRPNNSALFFFALFPYSIMEVNMEIDFNEAVDKGKRSAVSAVVLWVCAAVGAVVIKSTVSFIKWVFQK